MAAREVQAAHYIKQPQPSLLQYAYGPTNYK